MPGKKKNTSILFTKREKQIVDRILHGRTSKQIAEEFFISIYTVNNHRKSILSKAGVSTVAGLISKAHSDKWDLK